MFSPEGHRAGPSASSRSAPLGAAQGNLGAALRTPHSFPGWPRRTLAASALNHSRRGLGWERFAGPDDPSEPGPPAAGGGDRSGQRGREGGPGRAGLRGSRRLRTAEVLPRPVRLQSAEGPRWRDARPKAPLWEQGRRPAVIPRPGEGKRSALGGRARSPGLSRHGLGMAPENRMWQRKRKGESGRWNEWKLQSYFMHFSDCLHTDPGLATHRTVTSHKRAPVRMRVNSPWGGLPGGVDFPVDVVSSGNSCSSSEPWDPCPLAVREPSQQRWHQSGPPATVTRHLLSLDSVHILCRSPGLQSYCQVVNAAVYIWKTRGAAKTQMWFQKKDTDELVWKQTNFLIHPRRVGFPKGLGNTSLLRGPVSLCSPTRPRWKDRHVLRRSYHLQGAERWLLMRHAVS